MCWTGYDDAMLEQRNITVLPENEVCDDDEYIPQIEDQIRRSQMGDTNVELKRTDSDARSQSVGFRRPT
jgi:hypothetical protein